MNRNERAKIAQETLDILKNGYYMKDNKESLARADILPSLFLSDSLVHYLPLSKIFLRSMK